MPLPAIPAVVMGPIGAIFAAPFLVKVLVVLWIVGQIAAFLSLVFVSTTGLNALIELLLNGGMDGLSLSDPLVFNLLSYGGVFDALEVILVGVNGRLALLYARFMVGRRLAANT